MSKPMSREERDEVAAEMARVVEARERHEWARDPDNLEAIEDMDDEELREHLYFADLDREFLLEKLDATKKERDDSYDLVVMLVRRLGGDVSFSPEEIIAAEGAKLVAGDSDSGGLRVTEIREVAEVRRVEAKDGRG